tara:strand:+ start:478 stop:924 length:447 start_codon:yes stop_codon:yes gene_type:complete
MALRPGGAKAKGAAGELEAARLLVSWAQGIMPGATFTRNLEQVRGGGHDLLGLEWLAIEVKRQEALSVSSWWGQTVRQADAVGGIPFLMWRQNRKKWQFRVRIVAAHYGPHGSGTQPLDVDLDLDQAKAWFQGELYYRTKEMENAEAV